MFFLRTKYNKKITEKERRDIAFYAKECNIDIKGVEFCKNTQLNWKTNVACFSLLYRNTVFFCDVSIWKVFPAIAHELKHREQFQRMGFFVYTILAFPLWRKWTIEPEAYAEQDRIEMEVYNEKAH